MVTHIVMWKFGNAQDMHEAKSRLESIASLIPQIVAFEVGIDFNRSPAAFDLALYSTFLSREDLAAYQVNPEHVAVAQYIGSVATSRGVVDYEM